MNDWPPQCPACDSERSEDGRAWHDHTGHCKACRRHPYRILSFEDGYRFLSNFYPAPVMYLGQTFPTVEHAYQAAKTKRAVEREHIRNLPTPSAAKKFGRQVTLRADWEEVKDQVMLKLLRQKFSIPELRQKLLATGNAYLEEGNWWGDVYWGVYKGKGQNKLGMLLMQVRLAIQSEPW